MIRSGDLERLLGASFVEKASLSMRDWYGPPIAIAGTNIVVEKGGDFSGQLDSKSASFGERLDDCVRQSIRRLRKRSSSCAMASMGFSSVLDLLQSIFQGRQQRLQFHMQVRSGGAHNNILTSWCSVKTSIGSGPSIAPRNAAAPPTGTQYTRSDADPHMQFRLPPVDEELFLTGSQAWFTYTGGSAEQTLLLLYDRLWASGVDCSVTTPVEHTGVPSRYQSTSPGWDYCSGNFMFPEIGSYSGQAGHDWTGNYINQDGNSASFPLSAGLPNNFAESRVDINSVSRWFIPLASGDHGVKSLTQTTISASLAGTTMNWVIGKPVAFLPTYFQRLPVNINGINSIFRMNRIHRDACLELMLIDTPLYGGSAIGHLELVNK